jgi:hypothetical protein
MELVEAVDDIVNKVKIDEEDFGYSMLMVVLQTIRTEIRRRQ